MENSNTPKSGFPLHYKMLMGVGILGLWAVAGYAIMDSAKNSSGFLESITTADVVTDIAGLMSKEQEQQINLYNKKLLEAYDIDYRVVTMEFDGDLATVAPDIFDSVGVGAKSKTGRGLLLMIDPSKNQVHVEVSMGLDAVYTDAFVSYIENRQMIPFFQANKIGYGIQATTEMIFMRAQEATAGQQFMPPQDAKSVGAGVSNPAKIGAGEDMTFRQGPDVAAPVDQGPLLVLAAYQGALEARNGSPELSIYSQDSKAMLRKWTVTAAQMDNEARSLRTCPKGEVKISGMYAVVRRGVKNRQCPPYFFVHENGGWKLEFSILQSAIRFNNMNEWHFDFSNWNPKKRDCVCHYMFAFEDWTLNKHGYPYAQKKLRWNMRVGTYTGVGTIIEDVGAGSPAAKIGFRAGDRVLQWESLKNPHFSKVIGRMDDLQDGQQFTVILKRGSEQVTLNAVAPPKVQ